MKPARFSYATPTTEAEALALLAEHGEVAKVIAGGQSLVPLMNLRLAQPGLLVDVNRIGGLDRIDAGEGTVAVGANVRQRALERSAEAGAAAPLLERTMPWVGHVATRSRGTVIGNLVHADPASELPAVLLALDGEVVAKSSRGERTIPAAELFRTQFTTAVADDELVTEARFPSHPGDAAAFVELARRHGDFAIVGAAARLKLSDGTCEQAAVALCGVSDTPVRLAEVESMLAGNAVTDELRAEAAATASAAVDPSGGVHGSGPYVKRMAGVMVSRALAEAVDGDRSKEEVV
jgi:carbon-monoxide dehydrogenase medium subunit